MFLMLFSVVEQFNHPLPVNSFSYQVISILPSLLAGIFSCDKRNNNNNHKKVLDDIFFIFVFRANTMNDKSNNLNNTMKLADIPSLPLHIVQRILQDIYYTENCMKLCPFTTVHYVRYCCRPYMISSDLQQIDSSYNVIDDYSDTPLLIYTHIFGLLPERYC